MSQGKRWALLLGSIPFLTLVFALPFVNRVEPIIFGLPFLLFWIILWVFLTPFILMAAYRLEKKFDLQEGEGQESQKATEGAQNK